MAMLIVTYSYSVKGPKNTLIHSRGVQQHPPFQAQFVVCNKTRTVRKNVTLTCVRVTIAAEEKQ